MHIFMHRQLECADQRRFHRGDVYFAVALTGVAVPYLQQRSGSMPGKKKRRSGVQLFIVDISAKSPCRSADNPAIPLRLLPAYTTNTCTPRNNDYGAQTTASPLHVHP